MNMDQSDELLIRLFQRHFADPVAALLRLEKHLTSIQLPFDLKRQLRELPYPPQPGLPYGLPSFIYYYVPNSGWGSHKPMPQDPLDVNFVYATDGIGLNLGCPVRLLRALDALIQLRMEDQQELRNNLANPTQHLAGVEELLWVTGWKALSEIRRGGAIPGAQGNVDWAFKSSSFPIYMEAKYRPSDWPRLSDQGTFIPMTGSFLGKAANKFPLKPHGPFLYIVGITTMDNLTKELVHQIGQELEANPQIHCVVCRTFIQMTHVIALDIGVRDKVLTILNQPSTKDYPTNYGILFHIKHRDQRVLRRSAEPKLLQQSARVVCGGMQPELDGPIVIPGDAYRLNIPSRRPDGEPEFQVIPKRIWVTENQSE